MAHELDLQGEWQRLYELYHAMSDVELLELAERPDDLTNIAWDVLGREMKSRKLSLLPLVPVVNAVPPVFHSSSDPDWAWLDTFEDALNARIACETLELAEIPFTVRDESSPQYGLRAEGGPAVWLAVDVEKSHLQRARSILHERLGRFPVPESETEDVTRSLDLNRFWSSVLPVGIMQAVQTVFPNESGDDETDKTFTPLGYFETIEETQEFAGVLERAGLTYRVADRTGDADLDDEYRFEVQIHGADLPQAAELMERELPLEDVED